MLPFPLLTTQLQCSPVCSLVKMHKYTHSNDQMVESVGHAIEIRCAHDGPRRYDL